MTPQDVITETKRIVQDNDLLRTSDTYSEATLLGFVNQTLKRIAILRPDLFAEVAEITLAPNTALQDMPSDSIRLIEIFNVKDGNAITEVDRKMLNCSFPEWTSGCVVGQPTNFMRHPRNANKFFVYPIPRVATIVIAEYAKAPPNYAIDEDITVLNEVYFPVLVDGTVFLVESVANKNASPTRAKLFQDSFAQTLGAGLQSRIITDIDSSGLDMKQVL